LTAAQTNYIFIFEARTTRMYDIFLQYVADYSGLTLTDEEIRLITGAFKLKKLRKRQYLLQEGDPCKYLSFINKGALRQFSVDDKGNEYIVRFGIERWWVSDYEAFISETPSVYNIEALEDCELLLVTKPDLNDLKITVPAINRMVEKMNQRSYITHQQRIHSSISNTAEDRYTHLMETYPQFLQRFPQNMIASYLGISPETLSRIRKQMAGK
jgi:CRP-like cAMP-binding protein